MLVPRYSLFSLLVLPIALTSCSSIPFKTPPPNDVETLNAFPKNLIGEYVVSETSDKKTVPAEVIACQEKMVTLKIEEKKFTWHEMATGEYKINPPDTSVTKVTKEYIHVKEYGTEGIYPYITCDGYYIAIKNDRSETLPLSDSIVLKNVGQYYFLSTKMENLWVCIVLKSEGSNLKWLSTLPNDNKKELEAKLKSILPTEKVMFMGEEAECVDANTKQMLELIDKGVYLMTFGFRKIK